MKRMILAFLVFAALIPAQASARRRWRRSRVSVVYSVVDVWGDAQDDQGRCEAEAAYMAANYAYYHVGRNIGNFEGWGTSSQPDCATCTPSYQMTLTGDASAQAANGQWFRVRSWR